MSVTKMSVDFLLNRDDSNIPINSTLEKRDIIPSKAMDIALLCTVSDQVSELAVTDMFSVTQDLLDQTDKDCEPDITTIFSAHINTMKLNKELAGNSFKEQCDIINQVTDWIKYIHEKASYYHIENVLDYFLREQRIFCQGLREFNINISKSRLETDIVEELSKLRILRNNIQIAFNQAETIIKTYEKSVPITIGKPSTFERVKNTWKNILSFSKWIWKYKSTLYLIGLLVYNVYTYVATPYGNIINLLVNTLGPACIIYGKKSNVLKKLKNLIPNLMTSITRGVFTNILDSINPLIPEFIRTFFQYSEIVIFYIITKYILGWLKYMIKLVCQAVIMFTQAYYAANTTISDIWINTLNTVGSYIVDPTNTITYITTYIQKYGDLSIYDMITLLFTDSVCDNIVNIVWVNVTSYTAKWLESASKLAKSIDKITDKIGEGIIDIKNIVLIPKFTKTLINPYFITTDIYKQISPLSQESKNTLKTLKILKKDPHVIETIVSETNSLSQTISNVTTQSILVNQDIEKLTRNPEKNMKSILVDTISSDQELAQNISNQNINNTSEPILWTLLTKMTDKRSTSSLFTTWSLMATIFRPLLSSTVNLIKEY